MTKNRNLKHRIRVRAAKTGESYSAARRFLVPADQSASRFEIQRPNDYLLRAAGSPIGKAYKSLAIEKLAVEADSDILDLGCGTGGELGPLLRAIGPAGSVTGVDTDAHALNVARQQHRDPRMRLLIGDAHALDLADASMDRVYVDRTMQHVETPARVLEEVVRVLEPGGRIVLAEPDWQSLLVDHPEPDLSNAYRQFVVDRVIRNPRVGSELPRLVHHARLELESVTPVTATYTNVTDADQVFGFARVTRRAVEARYLDDDQADRWIGHLGCDVFFASLTIFVTAARRAS